MWPSTSTAGTAECRSACVPTSPALTTPSGTRRPRSVARRDTPHYRRATHRCRQAPGSALFLCAIEEPEVSINRHQYRRRGGNGARPTPPHPLEGGKRAENPKGPLTQILTHSTCPMLFVPSIVCTIRNVFGASSPMIARGTVSTLLSGLK